MNYSSQLFQDKCLNREFDMDFDTFRIFRFPRSQLLLIISTKVFKFDELIDVFL